MNSCLFAVKKSGMQKENEWIDFFSIYSYTTLPVTYYKEITIAVRKETTVQIKKMFARRFES